jgi:hypothetical protein
MTWWAAGAAVVGAIGGALISSDAAGDAADQQAEASAAAIAEQRRRYDQSYADYTPYRETGVRALGQLETEINTPVTSADAMSDPGYQFGLQQGQQALDRKASAAGGRVSGASLKSASEYATNYATTGYNAAYQRRQDRLSRLSALANIGQISTGGSAAAGASAGNAISNMVSAQGNANGAAQLAQGNIWGNTVNQLGAVAQKWAERPPTVGGASNVAPRPSGTDPAYG